MTFGNQYYKHTSSLLSVRKEKFPCYNKQEFKLSCKALYCQKAACSHLLQSQNCFSIISSAQCSAIVLRCLCHSGLPSKKHSPKNNHHLATNICIQTILRTEQTQSYILPLLPPNAAFVVESLELEGSLKTI